MGQLLSSLKPPCSSSPSPCWRSHDRVPGTGQTADRGCRVTRLFVIRHALAVDPDDHRLPGLDGALLPEGRAQARLAAHRLRDFAPSAVYSSDARRARETGEIIAAACQIPLEVNAALGEIDFGIWAGRT